MQSQKEDLREFQRLIKKYNYCTPMIPRYTSPIELSFPKKLSVNFSIPTQLQTLKPTVIPTKDYYHLNNIKYQNYKYIKHKVNSACSSFEVPTTSLSTHLKQHSMIPKEKKIESIYNQRKNDIPLNNRYRTDKTNRILNSRYKQSRNINYITSIPIKIKQNNDIFNSLEDLKQNINKINKNLCLKKDNGWVSPFMVRLDGKDRSLKKKNSRLGSRSNGLQLCVGLFQDLIKRDVEKNVRLGILSSGSKRKFYENCLNNDNNHIVNEKPNNNNNNINDLSINNKGSIMSIIEKNKNIECYKTIEDERVSMQSFKEFFQEEFDKKQWERMLFSIGIKYNKIKDDYKVSFENFLFFFKVFLRKSASLEEKHEVLKRSLLYPNDISTIEMTENLLKNCLQGFYNKNMIEILSKQLFEMILDKNRHKNRLDEMIEIIYIKKNIN